MEIRNVVVTFQAPKRSRGNPTVEASSGRVE